MVRKFAFLAVALLLVAGVSLAAEETMEATGTVKTVVGNTVTVAGDGGEGWAFEVTPDSVIKAKGASHKVKDIEEGRGEDKTLDAFVKADQKVTVQYWKKDDKMYVKELRVN